MKTRIIDDDGFNAMGKPIPNARRDRAYQWAKSIGVERAAAFAMVEAVANKLERDEPHEAREEAMKTVDFCGSYVLFAYLLTGPQ